jgi:hypothetical protein
MLDFAARAKQLLPPLIASDLIRQVKRVTARMVPWSDSRPAGVDDGDALDVVGVLESMRGKEDAQIKKVLEGDEGGGAGGDGQLERPKRGDALTETMAGFWALSYPELFPFGCGDFNEPRQKNVKWHEWVDWVMHQDSGELYTPIPYAEGDRNYDKMSSDEVNAVLDEARQNDSPIRFLGQKTHGTKSGDRWARYKTATTIREAEANGATAADLKHDLQRSGSVYFD